ncbi:MAG: bifunctional (p)ppGpp synthetase/guanosine-3',5'-bis(diphosphate) 3'-pyrophosphohydrolase [Synergistaceae bacterium]|nr:bifunctional (p)ppGpp synthetase/guanosine-3',5'-bis(diphosphate) 3'-pyrophosphohydrolase [Synergistaceae bacterium]
MIYSELVNKAIDIAYEAHHGQKDKAGRPYIVHVLHVAEQMDDEYSACAALLHDTLEDTELKAEVLERIFPREVVDAVKVLTHDGATDYMSYVREVRRNPIARKVKIADLEHNLDVSRFAGTGGEQSVRPSAKYMNALEILRRGD